MQGCGQRKLLKNEAHLREISCKLFYDRLGRLAVRTLQVTKLRNQDGRVLGATAGAIDRLQLGSRRRVGIRAEGNDLAYNRSLPSRWQENVVGSVLVDGHQKLGDPRNS